LASNQHHLEDRALRDQAIDHVELCELSFWITENARKSKGMPVLPDPASIEISRLSAHSDELTRLLGLGVLE